MAISKSIKATLYSAFLVYFNKSLQSSEVGSQSACGQMRGNASMEADDYVVVIGSAGLDIKARPDQRLAPGISSPGVIRNTVGGVARNIAENLARLEVPTTLLTVLGQDVPGQRVLHSCHRAGINTQSIQQIRGERTGCSLALLDAGGSLHTGINDFAIVERITADYIREHEALLMNAVMIVIDATLNDDAMRTVFEIAEAGNLRVAADPTNPTLAARLCGYLDRLYLVVPNAAETTALCGVTHPAVDRESALDAARTMVASGVEIAVVTLGDQGLAYAHSGGGGYIKAIHTKVVDTTGAGDAFSGAVIFGLLNGVEIDEAMRLGVTAASLTLQSTRTVLPTLTQELLYSKLMV
jgi:pseudouridine kinase